MGQQLRKIVKRRRRTAYLARKKALAKSGVVRKANRAKSATEETAKKAVKKVVKKSTKAPTAKKAAKPAEAPAAE